MLTAMSKKDLVFADSTPSDISGLRCRFCEKKMIFKNGKKVIAHFAHHYVPGDDKNCIGVAKYGRGGESYEHMELKRRIFNDAKASGRFQDVTMEQREGDNILDVALFGKKRKMAIEIQLSNICWDDIAHRMHGHHKAGFSTLWVVAPPRDVERLREVQKEKSKIQYKAKMFQQNLEQIGLGALFFYRGDMCFDYAHLMGNRVRTQHYKMSFRPWSIVELEDHALRLGTDDGGLECTGVTVPRKGRWWNVDCRVCGDEFRRTWYRKDLCSSCDN